MKKRWIGYLLAATITVLAIAGCSVTEEQIENEARSMIENKLMQDPKEPNEEKEGLSFFANVDITIEPVNEFNYVVSSRDTTYLLFKNDDVDYVNPDAIRDDMMLDKEVVSLETFTNDNNVNSYIVITNFEDETYRLIVAVDGLKMTTVLPLEELESSAEFMFDFVYSMAQNSND